VRRGRTGPGLEGCCAREVGQRRRRAGLFVEKGDGLERRDLKGFAATNVRAGELVVAADHIGLRLGELGAVALICVTGELGTFAPHDPGDLVFAGLSAFGTGEVVCSRFSGLVEKVAFFHVSATPLSEEALPWKTQRQSLVEISSRRFRSGRTLPY